MDHLAILVVSILVLEDDNQASYAGVGVRLDEKVFGPQGQEAEENIKSQA